MRFIGVQFVFMQFVLGLLFVGGVPHARALSQQTTRDILWAEETTHGFRSGAVVLSSLDTLHSGDTITVQFLLKNESNMTSTIRIRTMEKYGGMFSVSADNQIDGDVSPDSKSRKLESAYRLAPGEVLEEREYRVTYPTKGLPPGEYALELGYAFWLSKIGGRNSFDSHRLNKSLNFQIQGVKGSAVPPNKAGIHWGQCRGGICLGAKLVEIDQQGREETSLGGQFAKGQKLQAKLYAFNTSDEPLKVRFILFKPALQPLGEAAKLIDYRLTEKPRLGGQFLGSPYQSLKVALEPHELLPLTGKESPLEHPSLHFIEATDPPAEQVGMLQMFSSLGEYKLVAALNYQVGENPHFQFSRQSGEMAFRIVGPNDAKK